MNADTRKRDWRPGDDRLPASTAQSLSERAFRQGDIPAVRRFTRAFGARAGIGAGRLADFVLAVSEAAACATGVVGPCTARVRLWMTGGRAYCEVHGDGLLLQRSPRGPRLGEEEAMRRRVLRQLSDFVSVAAGPDGTWVRLSMQVA